MARARYAGVCMVEGAEVAVEEARAGVAASVVVVVVVVVASV